MSDNIPIETQEQEVNDYIEAIFETEEAAELQRIEQRQRELLNQHNNQVEKERINSAPGQSSYPDDQGNFETCTRHALAKVCVWIICAISM